MAEWIWIKGAREEDSYAEFKREFSVSKRETVTLKISTDSIFAAYVNGSLAGFSGCADYPHYKLYDEYDISALCEEKNELYVIVWYHGRDTQTYINSDPGLWFEVCEGENPIAVSDTDTVGRKNINFKNGYCKLITHQLGFSYYYDNTVENREEYKKTVKIDKMQPTKRPQRSLVLEGRVPVTYENRGDCILVDMGREVAGYAELDFESPCEQELLITFGEHLETGKVLRLVGGRDFSFEFKAKKGKNKWFIPLRRLACRYFEVYFKEPIIPDYIGMQHVYYPVTEREKHFSDPLLQSIYDVSVRTLRLCMHEHYEDCPWREQALYALDSRNQMLFGYHAFLETEYPRSNLLLINQGLRPDGLLTICFPAGKDAPIPFFSLAFILEVCEYAKNTGDLSILEDTKETVKTIINTFESRIGECGLIPQLPYPYWNFYEWSEGNSGNLGRRATDPYIEDYDLILNAFYVYVIKMYNEMTGTNYDTEKIASAIKRELYDEERGLYRISVKGTLYGQLGNALAILAGLGDAALARRVAECRGLTPATLSMKPFVYDALLLSSDEYKSFVLDDIKRVYKKMLDKGATSFWETERGWEDFSFAGSLCHGWSASPVYYFNKLKVE